MDTIWSAIQGARRKRDRARRLAVNRAAYLVCKYLHLGLEAFQAITLKTTRHTTDINRFLFAPHMMSSRIDVVRQEVLHFRFELARWTGPKVLDLITSVLHEMEHHNTTTLSSLLLS